MDLWNLKRPLCQLSHNQCPFSFLSFSIFLSWTSFWWYRSHKRLFSSKNRFLPFREKEEIGEMFPLSIVKLQFQQLLTNKISNCDALKRIGVNISSWQWEETVEQVKMLSIWMKFMFFHSLLTYRLSPKFGTLDVEPLENCCDCTLNLFRSWICSFVCRNYT